METAKKYHLQIIILILFLMATKMDGQKKNYIIIKEEHPILDSELLEFEKSKQIKFPEDYRNFLLKYNGGVIHPNMPKASDIYPIERFYSLGDIKLGVIANQREIREAVKYDIENRGYKINPNELIFIGVCEIGNLLIHCGKADYGAIYKTNYSGGHGLQRSRFSSFTELVTSMKWLGESDDKEYSYDEEKAQQLLTDKVFKFDYLFYWEEDVAEKSFKRFKEVLDFYGHPNKEYTTYNSPNEEKEDVVSYYINEPKILKYLLELGGIPPKPVANVYNIESLKLLHQHNADLSRLLFSTSDTQVIKYLIENCNQDINQSYNGEYPLYRFAKIHEGWIKTDAGIIAKYEHLESIINLGFNIDFSVKDENGITLQERIRILKNSYTESKERLRKK